MLQPARLTAYLLVWLSNGLKAVQTVVMLGFLKARRYLLQTANWLLTEEQ